MDEISRWRDVNFRQHILQKIDIEAQNNNRNIPLVTIQQMEFEIFERARNKEEYLDFIAKLLLDIKETNSNHDERKEILKSDYLNSAHNLLKRSLARDESEFSLVLSQRAESTSWEDRPSRARHSSRFEAPEGRKFEEKLDFCPRDSRYSGGSPSGNFSGRESDRRDRKDGRPYHRENDNRLIHSTSYRTPDTHFSGDERDRRDRGDRRKYDFKNDNRPVHSTGETGHVSRNSRTRDELSFINGPDRSDHFRTDRNYTYTHSADNGRDNMFIETQRNYRPEDKRSIQDTSFLERRDRQKNYSDVDVKTVQNPRHTNNYSDTQFLNTMETSEDISGDPKDIKKRKFSGAASKKLKRLILEGVPYTAAVNQILKEREERERSGQLQFNSPKQSRPQITSKPNIFSSSKRPASKRFESRIDEPPRKKPANSQNTSTKNSDYLKVGIADENYPDYLLDGEHLKTLQQAVMKSIDDIPDNGPQVRFERCSFERGMLICHCTDDISRSWLLKSVNNLKPWKDARLKTFIGPDKVGCHIFTVLIPDEGKGVKLPQQTVFNRLKKMNHGLRTELWSVVKCKTMKGGHLYIISIDKASEEVLYKLNLRPYFGFGQLEFRRQK